MFSASSININTGKVIPCSPFPWTVALTEMTSFAQQVYKRLSSQECTKFIQSTGGIAEVRRYDLICYFEMVIYFSRFFRTIVHSQSEYKNKLLYKAEGKWWRVNVLDLSCSTVFKNESRNLLISVAVKVNYHRNYASRSSPENDSCQRKGNGYVESWKYPRRKN